VNQSARQMLAGLPVQMAEGGEVYDPMSAGRRRALESGQEAGWLQNVANVANTWLANPGTAAEAYDAMVKSGIGVKDLLDAGISQDSINMALRIETPEEQKAVNQAALTALTSTLSTNLASEIGARGAEAIYQQARDYVANLQQGGLTPQEQDELRRVATAQGWGFADIRAAGLDPSLLFSQLPQEEKPVPLAPPRPTAPPGGLPGGQPYTPVTVYDADQFAREQGGADLFAKGEPALDMAFRNSPPRTVSPVTGQYMYTPAAQLRPATGAGWSWTPPVVTSRPRELLDVGPTASASQQYAQSRQQQDSALRNAFAGANLPMSGANTYYWQSRLRGGDYSPGGTFDQDRFAQDFQSWAASQGSGTSGMASSSQMGSAIDQNQQMYDEFGNPMQMQSANPLAMAPKMFLGMAPQMFADGGEANARELLDRLKKPEGAEEQALGAEEPGFLDQIAQKARALSRKLADLTPMGEMEDYATRTSTLFYPKETELGGEADAMRHMLFQSEMAKRYGRVPATAVSALNEYLLGALQGQSPAERRMDMENDALGRDIGTSGMNQDERLRAIMERIDSGRVRTLKESQLGYKDGGEVSTEELIAQMDRIGSMPSTQVPQEDPVKSESRGLLDRLNSAFFENVTKPMVGSAVDMTVGLGDIAQLGTKYLAERAGIETEPFAPVSGRVQEALGVEGYDPYAPAAMGFQIAAGPMARFRSAAAPAVSAATRATVPGSADDMFKRLAGDVAKEGQVYAGAEAGAQIAREVAPDNFGAELVGSMLGGTGVNSAIAVDPRDMSRSAGITNMASYNSDVGSYSPYPFVRGREYPFVGRLDQYVADKVEGTLTKDQFLGQLRGKFRDYEILRAQRALSDLEGKDKVTASDLLTRLEQVYDPADYRTSMTKQGSLNYSSMDNPWSGGISEFSPATGRFGVISLSRGGIEGSAPSSLIPNSRLQQGRDILTQFTQRRTAVADSLARGEDLGRISILRDIVNDLPDSTEQNRLRYYIANVEDAVGQRQSIANELDVLQEDKEHLLKYATRPQFFEPAYREALERGGAPPEQLLQQAFDTAVSRAYLNQLEYLPEQYRSMFPQNIDLTGTVSYGDKVAAISAQIGSAPARAKRQLQYDIEDEIHNTLTAMEGYVPEFNKLFDVPLSNTMLGSNPNYKGQHAGITENKGNQIGFSRYTEVETPLPGETSSARGVYLHELQSDLLDDLRQQGAPRSASTADLQERMRQAAEVQDAKQRAVMEIEDRITQRHQEINALQNLWGSGEITDDMYQQQIRELNAAPVEGYDRLDSLRREMRAANKRKITARQLLEDMSSAELDEAFPGMERNSKALQQLMIKNAVASAVDGGYRFVALTSPEHSAQPQLYERVPQNARDVVKDLGEGFRVVDLTLEGSGGPFKTTAIVWGDDSAEGREAVNRILTRGVPFAEGGEVTSKPDDIKNLLSFLDK
jgi:hypothetical protein